MLDRQCFSGLVSTHVLTLLGAVAEGAPRTSCKDRESRNMSGLAIDHKHTRRVNSELPNATPMYTNRRSRPRPRRRTTPAARQQRATGRRFITATGPSQGARREKRGAGCDADLSPSCQFFLCSNKIYGTATIFISPGSS